MFPQNKTHGAKMQMRFDGYIGFPGGLIDDGESVVQGLNRELVEEMNLDIVKFPVKDDDFVTAHFCPNKNICLNFYAKEVLYEDIKLIESSSMRAGDHGSEVLGTFRVPLYTMGDGYRGFPAFLANNFAGNSKQQLTYSLVHLGIMSAQEIDESEKAKPLHMDSN
uniref:U8 snoRNA-decapping enzyme n=1 Tax=Timema bartmani TaxID=61472 RepID=A0A7R9FBD1_9NEOP|nr:unnamed protein product [Timema bartmani]